MGKFCCVQRYAEEKLALSEAAVTQTSSNATHHDIQVPLQAYLVPDACTVPETVTSTPNASDLQCLPSPCHARVIIKQSRTIKLEMAQRARHLIYMTADFM